MEFGAVILIGNESTELTMTRPNGTQSTAQSRILSRFAKLKSLDHKNLCKYVSNLQPFLIKVAHSIFYFLQLNHILQIEIIRCHSGASIFITTVMAY